MKSFSDIIHDSLKKGRVRNFNRDSKVFVEEMNYKGRYRGMYIDNATDVYIINLDIKITIYPN